MKKNNERDIWSTFLVFVLGLGTTIGSFNYQIGTLKSMGPGYFPLILGIVLISLSFFVFFSSEDKKIIIKNKENKKHTEINTVVNQINKNRLRVWFFVVFSMLSFVTLSIYIGLLVSTFTLVFIAALADKKNTIRSSFFLSFGLVLFVVLVFHYFLEIQIPLWVN